jgi:hypothetical protein
MGINTSSAKSFEDMANEQENAESTTVENTEVTATVDNNSCDGECISTEEVPCTDESCDCNGTPKL